jgi:tetratricopeptide (TPR) repeat protein
MKKHNLILTLILTFVLVDVGWSFDTVKTFSKGKLSGRITGMDSTKIDLQQGVGGAVVQEVPVNEIQSVDYEAEPADLRAAKKQALDGHYADALAALERIKEKLTRAEMQQDVAFYKALCSAKLALGGSMKIADAGRMMKGFADANPKSYHYLEASETVGDLLVALGQYAQAAEYYARLENAPWPDYKMRAGVDAGRALLKQGKAREAAAAFDKVIANDAEGDLAQAQRTAASLGKASALVALKKPDEAVAIVDEIIRKGDPEDVPLMARAYNVLGNAQRQAGRVKEALLAFLHVDILYSSVPEAHAEALANLADLWQQVHKIDRANRARQTLEELYKDSPWAKKKDKT